MLRDRRALMEHDIHRMTTECGLMYMDMMRTGQTTTPGYDALLSKLIKMTTELAIVNKMIEQGHR